MANIKQEKMLIETMKNILKYGNNKKICEDKTKTNDHNTQFQWEDINRDFALKIKNVEFFDTINAAFFKIHSYKWLEDPSFEESIIPELKSQGVPNEEIEIAIKAIESLRKEYLKDNNNENASGWAPNLDDIKNSSNPKNSEITKQNIDTMSKDNEPFSGAEPKNVRPIKSKA